MVSNCFGMLIAEIMSSPQGIPLGLLLVFAVSLYPLGFMLGTSCQGCCGGDPITCNTLTNFPCIKLTISGCVNNGSSVDVCKTQCDNLNGTYTLYNDYNTPTIDIIANPDLDAALVTYGNSNRSIYNVCSMYVANLTMCSSLDKKSKFMKISLIFYTDNNVLKAYVLVSGPKNTREMGCGVRYLENHGTWWGGIIAAWTGGSITVVDPVFQSSFAVFDITANLNNSPSRISSVSTNFSGPKCSGTVSFESVANPTLDPTKNNLSCVKPQPGDPQYDKIPKDPINQWIVSQVTQATITISGFDNGICNAFTGEFPNKDSAKPTPGNCKIYNRSMVYDIVSVSYSNTRAGNWIDSCTTILAPTCASLGYDYVRNYDWFGPLPDTEYWNPRNQCMLGWTCTPTPCPSAQCVMNGSGGDCDRCRSLTGGLAYRAFFTVGGGSITDIEGSTANSGGYWGQTTCWWIGYGIGGPGPEDTCNYTRTTGGPPYYLYIYTMNKPVCPWDPKTWGTKRGYVTWTAQERSFDLPPQAREGFAYGPYYRSSDSPLGIICGACDPMNAKYTVTYT